MSNFSLNEYLFGPLDTEYCVYFYALSVVNFLFIIFFVLYLGYSLIAGNSTTMNSPVIIQGIFGCSILYFQNRLLHSMCSKSEGMATKYRR